MTHPELLGTPSGWLSRLCADAQYTFARLVVGCPVRGLPLLAATCATVISAVPSRGQRIRNPSFERPAVVGNTWRTFCPNDDLDGWTVVQRCVDVHSGQGGVPWEVPNGRQAIDLNGSAAGGVTQTVTLTIGRLYALTFWMAGNPACSQGVKRMQVLMGDQDLGVFEFDTRGKLFSNMGWERHVVFFQAGASQSALTFLSLTGSPCGPAIDLVKLAPAIST